MLLYKTNGASRDFQFTELFFILDESMWFEIFGKFGHMSEL